MSLPVRGKLPNKLSALLLVAMADLEKAEQNPDVKIDMSIWLRTNHKCVVCMAGAVMIGTLGVTNDDVRKLGHRSWNYNRHRHSEAFEVTPASFDSEQINGKLQAINLARAGRYWAAVDEFLTAVHGEDQDTWPPLSEGLREALYALGDDYIVGEIVEYSTRSERKRELWRAQMLTFIGILQAEGL